MWSPNFAFKISEYEYVFIVVVHRLVKTVANIKRVMDHEATETEGLVYYM